MSKSLAASKKVMKNYLSELLTEQPCSPPSSEHDVNDQANMPPFADKRLESLLKNVNVALDENQNNQNNNPPITAPVVTQEVNNSAVGNQAQTSIINLEQNSGNGIPQQPKAYRQGDFQTLFFSVGGLTVALPLIELGGIHKIDKITPLIGKPNWYQGVMLYRAEKVNVVDTALWVMPEKYNEAMKSALNYQYVIMLSNSGWGLTAEHLVETVVLRQDEVKWLDKPGKRPWLAGLVKDKMCALLDVKSLIQLLNQGSEIHPDD